ncbi:MAG TPA: aminotransferase class III-fold pyridoxal phosphate-dependent enzyme [Thermoleophilaceae bacterium]|jgi:putrescine aminotransferase
MSTTAQPLDVEGVYRRHLSSGRARVVSILGGQMEVSSSGSVVVDSRGDRYLNCGGYGVFLLGHGHPRVVEAVRAQVERHALSTRLFLDPTQARAAEAVAEVSPPGLDRVYFGTSGADAVEAAIKLARMHEKRRLVCAVGGFHGKTFGALSLCGNPTLTTPFEPLLDGIERVPFGDAAAMERAIADGPGEACVVVEPIQAEGGVRIPPEGYLADVAFACRVHGAMLVIDEIATGLGRVGAWWASEREGVVPDVVLAGKPLGGGVTPVGALLASEEAFAPLDRDPYIHSTTFSASPLVMAAVSATIEVLRDEDVPARADELGRRLLRDLRQVLAPAIADGLVSEIRGTGLLIGIEFTDPKLAGEFEIELVARRVVPNHCLNQHAVVRLTPPATLSDAEVAWLVDAAADSARAVASRRRAHRKARS